MASYVVRPNMLCVFGLKAFDMKSDPKTKGIVSLSPISESIYESVSTSSFYSKFGSSSRGRSRRRRSQGVPHLQIKLVDLGGDTMAGSLLSKAVDERDSDSSFCLDSVNHDVEV